MERSRPGQGNRTTGGQREAMVKRLELLCELKPGEPGTEELVERFGDALVCVRHWYDPERELELLTAEVVEARRPRWLRRRTGTMLEPRSPRRDG